MAPEQRSSSQAAASEREAPRTADPRPVAARAGRLGGRLLLALTGVVAALALLEGLARFVLPPPLVEKWPLGHVEPDPELGWRMVPGDIHYTYTHPVQINGLGLRGPEIGAKATGEYRILVLGDSHVYGQGVADERMFTTVLERRLNASNGDSSQRRFRVINAGTRAYATWQELAFLRSRGLALDPDLVVLGFYLNDLDWSDPTLVYEHASGSNAGAPYIFDLQMPDGPWARLIWEGTQVLRRWRTLMILHDRLNAYRARDQYEARLLRGTVDEDIERRFEATASRLGQFRDLLSAHGVRGLVALIPAPSQLADSASSHLYQERLAAITAAAGLATLDLLPGLQGRFGGGETLPLLPYDGHYDSSAHEVIAEQLCQGISSLLRAEADHGS